MNLAAPFDPEGFFPPDTKYVVSFPTPLLHFSDTTGYPTIQFNSDATYIELASDPTS